MSVLRVEPRVSLAHLREMATDEPHLCPKRHPPPHISLRKLGQQLCLWPPLSPAHLPVLSYGLLTPPHPQSPTIPCHTLCLSTSRPLHLLFWLSAMLLPQGVPRPPSLMLISCCPSLLLTVFLTAGHCDRDLIFLSLWSLC